MTTSPQAINIQPYTIQSCSARAVTQGQVWRATGYEGGCVSAVRDDMVPFAIFGDVLTQYGILHTLCAALVVARRCAQVCRGSGSAEVLFGASFKSSSALAV